MKKLLLTTAAITLTFSALAPAAKAYDGCGEDGDAGYSRRAVRVERCDDGREAYPEYRRSYTRRVVEVDEYGGRREVRTTYYQPRRYVEPERVYISRRSYNDAEDRDTPHRRLRNALISFFAE